MRAALETRRQLGIERASPVCAFDIVEKCKVEVHFAKLPTLEGLYVKEPGPVIFLSSLRPTVRQAFNCGHELGHHVFGHGTRADEYIEDSQRGCAQTPEEHIADTFSAHLLMPKQAVEATLKDRGITAAKITPLQAYRVANQLGVGYSTLITHICWSLGMIPADQANGLLKSSPKTLRAEVLNQDGTEHLVIADTTWKAVPIDLQVGHHVILPAGCTIQGSQLLAVTENALGVVAQAVAPGMTRVVCGDTQWAAFVRVSRREYEGRLIYRHLEDPDVDERA
ncbi:MAG TPA: ImmA/IrrE family metallo-endopeptidase [Planctomycetota bacterium]|nr:ImmA/IrrE family metallo-endopeptidase [Planctomycetota bacterium]